MKKKILAGIAVLAIATMAAFNVNLDTSESDLSALALANVEVLAGENSGTTYTYTCEDAIKEKKGNNVFYCGTCDWVQNSGPTALSSTKTCKKS
jgi:hypothetical protein